MMRRKLKLDLHTHCFEALDFPIPSVEVVSRIVAAVEESGLDGIAITEHNTVWYGFRARDIAEQVLNSEVLIIPGLERDIKLTARLSVQVVELYLLLVP